MTLRRHGLILTAALAAVCAAGILAPTGLRVRVAAPVADAAVPHQAADAPYHGTAAYTAPGDTATTEAESSDTTDASEAPALEPVGSGNFAAYAPPTPSGDILPMEDEYDEGSDKLTLAADWDDTPVNTWSRGEFERLAGYEDGEQSFVRTQPKVPAARPLAIEELLAANRAETVVAYRGASAAPDADTLPPMLDALPPGSIEVVSAEFLDYDEERSFIYGHGRIAVRYGTYLLKADRFLVDTRLKEIQAYGNVILTNDLEYIECESMWVNTNNGQGVAYKAKGRQGPLYFRGDPFKGDGTVEIHQVSKKEAIFRDASFTMCEFPVPHYRIRAKEFVLIQGERVFARNAVLYIHEVPVLWLPFYSRSLKDPIPWGATFGSDDELGYFARIYYNFYHSYYSPSDADDELMQRVTYSHTKLFVDYFSERGYGQGIDWGYYFNAGQHRGELKAYTIDDTEREVSGNDSSERYYLNWFHRARLADDLSLVVDTDYMSDPDIFYDILDRLRSGTDPERERVVERHMSAGLEWTGEDFFAGIQVEFKDRIGRDRVSNFSEARGDDFDYDRTYNDEEYFTLAAPGFGPDGRFYDTAGTYLNPASISGDIDRGLSSDRYGRVTERLPQLTFSSNRMRLWTLPLWYHVDINVFNNLDKGLNSVDTYDDAYVRGFDAYQSISHLLKMCDRYTLLTKVGFGFGVAERDDDSYNIDFPAGATFPYVVDGQVISNEIEGLTFVDEETFLIGEKEFSLSDVNPGFVYGDIDSKFNARLTDSLSAFVRYRMRKGTEDDIGHFYESMGNRKSKDDLYPFRTREHWVEAGLDYSLSYPRMNVNLSAGQNLESESELFPKELQRYANLSAYWSNRANTILVNGGVGLQDRQVRDPSDPNQYTQSSLTYFLSGSYMPVHQRYFLRGNVYMISNQDEDPLYGPGSRDFDTRDETIFAMSAGRKIGTKYLVQYSNRYRTREDSESKHDIRLERDFHDFIGVVRLSKEFEGGLSEDSEDEEEEDNLQVRFDIRFKPAYDKGVPPYLRTSDLFSARKVGAYETGS